MKKELKSVVVLKPYRLEHGHPVTGKTGLRIMDQNQLVSWKQDAPESDEGQLKIEQIFRIKCEIVSVYGERQELT